MDLRVLLDYLQQVWTLIKGVVRAEREQERGEPGSWRQKPAKPGETSQINSFHPSRGDPAGGRELDKSILDKIR